MFGEGGGQRLAEECAAPLMGRLPLALAIREAVDCGAPTVVSGPDSDLAKLYRQIALNIAAHLSLLKINYAAKFPKVVIE